MATTKFDEDVANMIMTAASQSGKLGTESGAPDEEVTVISSEAGQKSMFDVFKVAPSKGSIDIPCQVYEDTDWPEEIRAYIPSPQANYHFDSKLLQSVLFAIRVGGPMLLHGPTGTGKTSLLEQVCARLRIPFFKVSCHPQQEQSEFLGTRQVVNDNGVAVTTYSYTDCTLAATYGGFLCIDEAFRSPILLCIQSLLEIPHRLNLQDLGGKTRTLRPPVGRFWIGLTDNTTGTGDTTGSYVAEIQDLSTLNRIRHTLYVDYNTQAVEEQMLVKLFPSMPKTGAREFVQVARLIREAFVKGTIQQTFSIRDLIAFVENYTILKNKWLAFELCFFNKLSNDDGKVVKNCYNQVFAKAAT